MPTPTWKHALAAIAVLSGASGAAAAESARPLPSQARAAGGPHGASDPRQPDRNGVRGNAPFDNQIRKMTDPLNANGAK